MMKKHKTMKKILACFLASMMAAGLCACGQSADDAAEAADYLTIQPPSKIGRGVSISDFHGIRDGSSDEKAPETEESRDKDMDGGKRGRRVTERDQLDLLLALKAGRLSQMLRENDLIEELVLC